MTMSLDEVRNIRFPMARKPSEDGYRASAVDQFIDRVEVAYAELVEENEKLHAQLADYTTRPTQADDSAAANDLRDEIVRLEGELATARSQSEEQTTQLDVLRGSVSDLETQLAQAREEAQHLRDEAATPAETPAVDTTELDTLRARVAELESSNESLRSQQSSWSSGYQPYRATPTPTPLVDADGVQTLTVTTSEEASSAVVKLVALATTQAESVVADAETEATRLRTEAQEEADRLVAVATQQANELTTSSREEADRLTREAHEEADRVTADALAEAERVNADAKQRSEALTGEVDARRAELFGSLDADRDEFAGRVARLAEFEKTYRSTLRDHLTAQLAALDDTQLAPSGDVDLADAPTATPRLDALLHEDPLA